VADHAGAPAHVPFEDGLVGGVRERGSDVLRAHVHPVDVVQDAVPGLADDRKAPGPAGARGRSRGGDQGVADDADGVRVRHADRRRQHP
jgi:hypothetical protein